MKKQSNAPMLPIHRPLGRIFALSCFVWLTAVSCASTPINPNHNPDGAPRIFGKIVGPDGKGLDGVRITTEPQTDAVLTFEGEWEITRSIRTKKPIAPGDYQIVAYKLGWWRGKGRGAVAIEYPGGELKIPDIELVPIDSPEIEDLGLPVGGEDDSLPPQGSGEVKDGE